MFMHKLLELPFLYNAMRRSHDGPIVSVIKKEMSLGEGDRILDFGCGPATNTGVFRNSFYVGVDRNYGYVKYAKEKFPRKNLIVADISRSFSLKVRFDWILGNCVFHNLSDKDALHVLQEIKSLLKNNGKLLIIDLLEPGHNNYLGKLMVSLDRGRYPRSLSHYENLFAQGFGIIRKYVIKIWCWDFCIFLMSL